ncbi:cell wall-binding repeat-containing protein [Sutcliffiella halmapala]|uniref:cell wall-binding repeat-containing protein n=1 Tax=Sutcliffiella halmapala TaxID=79882 RepID=UPI001474481F|nr:cell wall-binding repeat-containing protein [Sutcliffiella halmapala]
MTQIRALNKNVTRISGSNRFDTTAQIINKFNMNTDRIFIANGHGFADALTGSVLAAKNNAPLLLVNGNSLPNATRSIVRQKHITNYTILGGPAAVEQSVIQELEAMFR